MKTPKIKYLLGHWRSSVMSAKARSHLNYLLNNPAVADCKLTYLEVF